MALMKRSGEWVLFGRAGFVRKLIVYDSLQWAVDISACTAVAPAPFGGPIAVVDEADPHTVEVFNAVGRKLFDAPLPPEAGRAVAVGWSAEETLVVATSKPACLLWLQARQAFHNVKLPRTVVGLGEAPVVRVSPAACVLAYPGLCCAVVFQEKREPAVVEVQTDAVATPTCVDVVAAHFTEDERPVLVLGGVSAKSRNVLVAARLEAGGSDEGAVLVSSSLPAVPRHVAVSPSGERVAVATDGGVVLTAQSDFSDFLKVVYTGVKEAPEALHWCGSDFLHLLYRAELFPESVDVGHFSVVLCATALSDHKDVVRWDLEGAGYVAAVAEVDGVRIVSDTRNHFFEVVPKCLQDIFAHKSEALTAAVCQACVRASSKSIEGITTLRAVCSSEGIYEALDAIVEAAQSEFWPAEQEQLLAVVALTKSQGRVKYDSDSYVDVCKRLRLFNAVRSADHCAIPLSQQQYKTLSGASELRQIHSREAQVLVDRLVQRGDYQWALNVANFIGMKLDKVLVQWSVAKVITATDDVETHREILSVLRKCPGAGFTEAALEAAAHDNKKLAVRLLDSEPRSQAQVLLLLQMGLDEIAMGKAVASQDADLTYLVLLKLMHHMPQVAFHAALRQYDAARLQFLSASQHSPSLARRAVDFLTESGSERHVAASRISAAFLPPEPMAPLDDEYEDSAAEDDSNADGTDAAGNARRIQGTMRVTPDLMSDVEALLAAKETTRDEARLCAVHRDLLKHQQALVAKTGDDAIMNTSVVATIKAALLHGLEDDAEELRRAFNVPEKKFWYTKLLALIDSPNESKWDALERMAGVGRYAAAKSVRSPIGYLPFVETITERGETLRAVPYVAKLATLVQRVEWYVKLDEFQKAVDDAYDDDNVGMLQQIRKRSQNPSMLQYIDERIKALS